MTTAELISQVFIVLITGIVGVLSARYGAKSSVDAAERQVRAALEVAEKNNRAALEQVSYGRVLQKREEVVSELYAGLKDFERKFMSLHIRVSNADTYERRTKDSIDFEHALGVARDYYDKNALWLSPESSQAVDSLLTRYLSLVGYVNIFIFFVEGEDPSKEDEYQKAREKLEQFAYQEYPAIEEALSQGFRDSINVTSHK